jgi:hypothetical protein
VQNLAQPRLGQALAACHWRLAKYKGRKAALRLVLARLIRRSGQAPVAWSQ